MSCERKRSLSQILRAFSGATIVLMAIGADPLDADVFHMPAVETSLQFVTVGDPGNAPDTTGWGAVPYTYRIGQFDVTSAQYAAFLNAVAKTDVYGLYSLRNGDRLWVRSVRNSADWQSGKSGVHSYSRL